MGQKIGYWFEDRIKASLRHLQEKEHLYFHRFQDSKAAGNITASAPADFLVAYQGEAQLWEAKASEVHFSLRECFSDMVDFGQAAQAMWWESNNLSSWYLFYSDKTGMVEAWDGALASSLRQLGKPLPPVPGREFHIDNLNTGLWSLLP